MRKEQKEEGRSRTRVISCCDHLSRDKKDGTRGVLQLYEVKDFVNMDIELVLQFAGQDSLLTQQKII